MTEELLEYYFEIKPEETIQDDGLIRYRSGYSLYTIINVTQWEPDTLIELYEMSEHLAKNGDQLVSRFIPTNEQKFLVTYKEQDYIVVHNYLFRPNHKRNIGRQLAIFHERGQYLPTQVVKLNRLGEWKNYWVKRLEQIEQVWSQMVRSPSGDPFDMMFIDSYPYYMGLCENAIQYYTDTLIDEIPGQFDQGTVCHQYFADGLWKGKFPIRNPFDWVFDHPARDLAEWVRDCYFRQPTSYTNDLQTFIQEYTSIRPLSRFGWRLLYARLLCPLHYIQCVEEYFLTNSEGKKKELEERLSRILRDASQYEYFLGNFYEIARGTDEDLPIVKWLKR